MDEDKVAEAILQVGKDIKKAVRNYMIFWGAVVVVLGVLDVYLWMVLR